MFVFALGNIGTANFPTICTQMFLLLISIDDSCRRGWTAIYTFPIERFYLHPSILNVQMVVLTSSHFDALLINQSTHQSKGKYSLTFQSNIDGTKCHIVR